MTTELVVTGLGCCTALGSDVEGVLAAVGACDEARERARPEELADGLLHRAPISVLRVAGPDPGAMAQLRRPHPDRLSLLAIEASDRALRSAGWTNTARANDRVALVVNTSFGPKETVERYLRSLLREGPGLVSPIAFSRSVANAVLGEIARRHALTGPSTLLMGSSVLGYAIDLVRADRADLVVCVGVDTLGSYTAWTLREAGMLGEGLVAGEASAAVIVESATSARRRGVRPRAVVRASFSGFCADAVQRITDFGPQAIFDGMQAVLRDADASPETVGTVVSLDNGHRPLARGEGEAIRRLFGERALRVLRPKRTLGEVFGASEVLGTLAATASLAAGHTGIRVGCLANTGHLGGLFSTTLLQRSRSS